MIRPVQWLPGTLFVLCAAIVSAAPSLAVCPGSDLSLSTVATYSTTAASLDSSSGENRVQFDLVAGTLGLDYCCSINPTFMHLRDAYDVTGVPPGTPVSLTVEVPVSGEIYDAGGCGGSGCGGSFLAAIDRGADLAEYRYSSPPLYYGARVSFSGVAQLPLTIIAGQPETVGVEFWARRATGGSHGAHALGTIRFTGLPPGAAVISCQGYQPAITPARRATWGRLKAIYR